MNAGTAEDSTNYFYSFPSNRHRAVVSARIRAIPAAGFPRILQRARRGARGAAHARRIEPAGQAGGGAAGDRVRGASLSQSCRADGPAISTISGAPKPRAFYKIYYTPGNITIGIAGDVNPAEAKRLAEKYFARLPRGSVAAAGAHRGAEAGRRKARRRGVAGAAVSGDRLQASGSVFEGRRGRSMC